MDLRRIMRGSWEEGAMKGLNERRKMVDRRIEMRKRWRRKKEAVGRKEHGEGEQRRANRGAMRGRKGEEQRKREERMCRGGVYKAREEVNNNM
jgi:hypothetical protein